MEFEIEIINGDVMVLETPSKNFKIVINIETTEVLHCEFVDMDLGKFNKYVGHAKSCFSKYLAKKAVEGFMKEE